jgi:hypothetical protein
MEREHERLPPSKRGSMKEYDLSDRKLKIGVVLAVAIIGWFCLHGASSVHAQTTPANLSPGAQEVVKLSQAHLSDDVILSYIKNSGVSYHSVHIFLSGIHLPGLGSRNHDPLQVIHFRRYHTETIP